MTDTQRENLSSLMDGELERSASQFLVRRLSHDPELAGQWQRYHLVRACLQRESVSGIDLGARVSAALAEDSMEPLRPAAGRWLKPVSGAVIAASVAVFALIGINSSLLEHGQQEWRVEPPGFVSRPTEFDLPFAQALVPVSFSESTAADRQRFSSYVLRHNQASGSVGFVSYVPIVVSSRTPPAAVEPAEPLTEPSEY